MSAATRNIEISCNGVNVTNDKTTRGELQVKTFKFVWKFKDFLKNSRDVKQTYVSPVFQVGNYENTADQTEWMILMFPFGNPLQPKHMFLWVVKLVRKAAAAKSYRARLAFLNNAGQEVYVQNTDIQKTDHPHWEFPTFISKDEFMENKDTLLVNGALSIVFEVEINPDSDENLSVKSAMTNDFEALFLSKRFSDLAIVVGDKEIKAHKNIVASRSKVFSAMLDTEVNNNNNITVDDVSYNVMQELLRFVYSGKINNRNINFVRSLLIAAAKYDVDSLKETCENILCESVGSRNACELLAVSHLHNCTRLKTVVMVFMIKNMKSIKSTPSFKKLQDFHPQLAQEVLRRSATKKIKP